MAAEDWIDFEGWWDDDEREDEFASERLDKKAEDHRRDCGGSLVRRTSRKGNTFLGCSQWPACNYTEND